MKKTKNNRSKESSQIIDTTVRHSKHAPSIPWCVDLDGTLIGSDVTFESLRIWILKYPLRVFKIPFMLMRGRGYLKAVLSHSTPLDVARLPFNPEVLEILQQKHRDQERLILVTAADKSIAEAVATHVGLFESVLGSDGDLNLRSHAKADALVSLFGEKGFSYMGNSKDDLNIWNKAIGGMGVGITPRVEDQIKRRGLAVRIVSRRPSGFSQMRQLLGYSPWSWAFFIFLGAMVQGTFSGTVFLAFLLFLCIGVTSTLLSYMVRCGRSVQEQLVQNPFCNGLMPLSMGFGLLGASILGVGLLMPFIPIGGWAIALIYGLVSYISALLSSRVSGHIANGALALGAFLGGLAL